MDKVLIIDDDRFAQSFLHKSLHQKYDVRTADDGLTGMRLAKEWHPDVILLDVEMPGRNGYEVCDDLKQSSETQEIPVVFLSSHSSVRERMLGFEVGGDDYLVKPCSKEILETKLDKLTSFFNQKRKLKQSATSAEKTAIEAMTTSFELGKAVRFVERTYTVASMDKLGKALMEVVNDLELSGCLMFKSRFAQHFYSSTSNVVAPLEMEILQMLHSEKRFTDFGCRTQINYPQVALLIKNMPLDDRARYGRLKDTIPFILGATDAKVRVLDAELALTGQNKKLIEFIGRLQEVLQGVSKSLEGNRSGLGAIMNSLVTEMSFELCKMGLEADQEEFVHQKVSEASDQLHVLLSKGEPLQSALEKTINLLMVMAEEQNKIITETLSSEDVAAEDITNDIELF